MGPQQAAPEATFLPLDGSRGPIYGRGPLEVFGGALGCAHWQPCSLTSLVPPSLISSPQIHLWGVSAGRAPHFHHRTKRRQVPYKVLQSLKANPSFSSICLFLSVYIYLWTKSS